MMSSTMNTSPKKPSPLSDGMSPRNQQQFSPRSSPARQNLQQQQNHSPAAAAAAATVRSRGMHDGGDASSRLPTAQQREMRESFQVLDRDNDGIATRDDVADMLKQLGLDPSILSQFPAQTNLASYLSSLATSLLPLSRPDELEAAFSAFDADDSGQVDVEELRRALLDTPPDVGHGKLDTHEIDDILQSFSGRRAFKRGVASSASRGQVFRYHDFISSVSGREAAAGDKEGEGQPGAVKA